MEQAEMLLIRIEEARSNLEVEVQKVQDLSPSLHEAIIEAGQKLLQFRLQPTDLFGIHAWSSLSRWRENRFVDIGKKNKGNLAL